VVLVVLGSFMFRQIPVTPALSTQLVLISLLFFAAAGWASMAAFRDLFGALTIDEEGIHASPKLTGFSVRWDDLQSWDVKEYAARPLSAPGMMFHRSEQRMPETLRCGFLGDHDVERVRQLLRLRASAAEQLEAPPEVG
jgi:hypothetical protein